MNNSCMDWISSNTAQDLHDKGLKISIHSTSSPFYMNRRLRSPVSHSGNARLLGECQGKLESGRERAVSVASCLQLHSICPLVHSRTTAWPVAFPILTEQPPPTCDFLNRGLPLPPESRFTPWQQAGRLSVLKLTFPPPMCLPWKDLCSLGR